MLLSIFFWVILELNPRGEIYHLKISETCNLFSMHSARLAANQTSGSSDAVPEYMRHKVCHNANLIGYYFWGASVTICLLVTNVTFSLPLVAGSLAYGLD